MPEVVRFRLLYCLLALTLAASAGAAWWGEATAPRPLSPAAVALVKRFLGSLQRGDFRTACRLFSALPACYYAGEDPQPLTHYRVYPAEPAVDAVDVPALVDGQYTIFITAKSIGRWRIVDVVADPSAPIGAPPPPPYAA
jgi:hypothetical protein